ncbi:T9SS type A sorting domain-containing protein [Brumimicrobium mesophilum]
MAACRIVYSSSKLEINVADVSSGVYFVNVRSAISAKTFKIIK